jgi:hypothetical protein
MEMLSALYDTDFTQTARSRKVSRQKGDIMVEIHIARLIAIFLFGFSLGMFICALGNMRK